jgi:hypothetical protein
MLLKAKGDKQTLRSTPKIAPFAPVGFSKTWTFFDGDWRAGNAAVMGARVRGRDARPRLALRARQQLGGELRFAGNRHGRCVIAHAWGILPIPRLPCLACSGRQIRALPERMNKQGVTVVQSNCDMLKPRRW